jgi:hypothetical protein
MKSALGQMICALRVNHSRTSVPKWRRWFPRCNQSWPVMASRGEMTRSATRSVPPITSLNREPGGGRNGQHSLMGEDTAGSTPVDANGASVSALGRAPAGQGGRTSASSQDTAAGKSRTSFSDNGYGSANRRKQLFASPPWTSMSESSPASRTGGAVGAPDTRSSGSGAWQPCSDGCVDRA